MKGKIQKEKKNQKLHAAYELERIRLKVLQKDSQSSWEDRMRGMLKLGSLPRNSSPTRLKNRCVLTGRSGSILRQFKLSRIKFRELAESGMLPGIRKSSW
jgi:small subunit ribosomal protein S14